MQPVVLTDVDARVAVTQGEDHARAQAQLRFGGHHGVHATWHVAQLAIGLHVVEQVHAEVIEPQVGDRHSGFQVFQLDYFLLQATQLLFAIRHVVGLGAQHVVVTGGRDVGNHHPTLNPFLEVDVLVERDVWPVVDQLDAAVG
ncbi:hypothetical protein GALL_404360 [mine drainage metagenome]|uniref:Uncharacterized protein n=1 Tax=mine drainage metagenome TaxID=410659 RepID=A0A1J5Q2D9_9ZZZZ